MDYQRLVFGVLLSLALFASPVFATQNVANTSQKGSLLKFPFINIQNEDLATTIIHVSNDANANVDVNCVYVNERKDRTDFQFTISHKGTVSWDVLSGKGEDDLGPLHFPLFPSGGSFPGNPNKGELTRTVATPVRWFHAICASPATVTAKKV